MDIKKRIESLKHSYEQLEAALNRKVDYKLEIEPEKMKITLSFYKLAAEDSKMIMNEILELEGKVIVSKEDFDAIEEMKKAKSKKKSGGLSPESRKL